MGQTIGKAAMKAGMHRNTATKYLRSGAWPSEQRTERAWRTREDPFVEDWPAIVARLGRLQMEHGARFAPSALLQEHARTGARFYDD